MFKKDFPALYNSEQVYLDSASSCQVPVSVINAISNYLANGHGNPHRGMHRFSETAESSINECRDSVSALLKCVSSQVVFTKGTTESINLVARSLEGCINESQSILVTQLEHHANLLPWQSLCNKTGAKLKLLPINPMGELDLSSAKTLLADNCVLLAITQTSNVLGISPPIKELIQLAKSLGVMSLVDGAQSVAHQAIDISALGCDFYAFSAHKIYGPSGIGVLYCRDSAELVPLQLGGGIVTKVKDTHYELIKDASRLEAGSANMLGIVGLNAALKYLQNVNIAEIVLQEKQLIKMLADNIDLQEFRIISHPTSTNILSIHSHKYHSHDIASVLADQNIASRAGHHCAQPCLNALDIKHCVRFSLGIYNTVEDIKKLIDALNKIPRVLN